MRWLAFAVLSVPAIAAADPRLIDDDTFAVRAGGELAVDGGLVLGKPAALGAGLATGVGGGVTRDAGCWLAYGARATWGSATESSQVWTVSQSDLRLRGFGALVHRAGRGTLALRLAAGPTIVHEVRTRNQGMRAGLTGSALETRAFDTLPAVDLEVVVAVGIAGPWQLVASGGPSIDYFGDALHGGFTAQLGLGWRP